MKYKKVVITSILISITLLGTSSCRNVYKKGVDYSEFPKKDVPIYDEAVVFEFEGGKDEMNLSYGTIDDIDDVIEFYQDEFDDSDYIILNEAEGKDEYLIEGYTSDIRFEIHAEEANSRLEEYYDTVVEINVVFGEEFNLQNYEKALYSREIYNELNYEIDIVVEQYLDDTNYFPMENKEVVLSEVMQIAENKFNQGTVTYYEKGLDCVYMEFSTGMGYVYLPKIADVDSSGDNLEIATIQPFYTNYIDERGSQYVKYMSVVDDAAREVEGFISEYSFDDNGGNDDNYDDEEVDIDMLKDFPQYSIIIWHGHGGYTEKVGSFLVTSVLSTIEVEYENWDDFETKRLILSGGGRAFVTKDFFDYYLEDNSLEGSLVYLGTCSSGVDARLAHSFINKGAEAVVANSGVIGTKFNLAVIETVFRELCTVNNDEYTTLREAVEKAVSKNILLNLLSLNTDVIIVGDSNYTLEPPQNIQANDEPASSYAENNEDLWNNKMSGGIACAGGGQIFYSGLDGCIYQYNPDGEDKKLNNSISQYLNIYDNKIYYCNFDDEYYCYSMNFDGSDNKRLQYEVNGSICIMDNYLYYSSYKINLDNGEKTKICDYYVIGFYDGKVIISESVLEDSLDNTYYMLLDTKTGEKEPISMYYGVEEGYSSFRTQGDKLYEICFWPIRDSQKITKDWIYGIDTIYGSNVSLLPKEGRTFEAVLYNGKAYMFNYDEDLDAAYLSCVYLDGQKTLYTDKTPVIGIDQLNQMYMSVDMSAAGGYLFVRGSAWDGNGDRFLWMEIIDISNDSAFQNHQFGMN